MKRRILSLLAALALALAVPGLSEAPEGIEDVPPEEIEEFELEADTPAPEATEAPTPQAEPLPTLEPGSFNYPAGKVDFEAEIWAILTRRWKLSDFQAAGLMSSLRAESSFCPYNAEGKSGVDNRANYVFKTGDSVGFGLCQWTTRSRKTALLRYAERHGDPNLVWDFDIQMGFMQSELNLKALRATGTLYDAAEWAVLWYERPNQRYENSWPGTRYEIARRIYRAHTGADYEEPPLQFDVKLRDVDASAGFEMGSAATLVVRSNYYWRLEARPAWLDVRARDLYDPGAWVPCACGYAGETQLRLRAALLPLSRDYALRFVIYRGARVEQTVPVRYTGKRLQEALLERLLPWALFARE